MGLGRGKGGEMSEHCITFSVLILNIFCGILGVVVFCLAVWFRFEGDVRNWVNDLEMYQYWTGLYILMAASAIIVFISVCGCTGTLTANSCLLATNLCMNSLALVLFLMGAIILLANYIRPSFDLEELQARMNYVLERKSVLADEFLIFLYYRSAVLVLAALILELAGGIYLVVHGTQSSKLGPWLDARFTRLIRDSNYNDKALDLLTVLQEKVGCCGAYNYQDFDRSRLPIPESCRDKVSGNVYQEGCVRRFAIFMEKRTGWIAGIALFIGFLQVILVALTFIHWKRVRTDDETDTYRDKTRYSTVPTTSRY